MAIYHTTEVMLSRQDIVQEIRRVEVVTLNVKKEIKSLKNRVRAYKGWTKRYRKQLHELKQDNAAISRQRDKALQDLQELQVKQQDLLQAVAEAKQAKERRDRAILQLDEVIAKIEQYREVCLRANKITYADKTYLIKEAERLFFDEEIISQDIEFDSQEQPQMLTDRASIGRSLLDR